MFKASAKFFSFVFLLLFLFSTYKAEAFSIDCANGNWALRGYASGPDNLEVGELGYFTVDGTYNEAVGPVYRLDSWVEYGDGWRLDSYADSSPWNTSNGQLHSFDAPGVYSVYLQAYVADGGAGQYCVAGAQVVVTAPPPPPTCNDPEANNVGGALSCTYTMVNLNFVVGNSCGGAVPAATVSISRDFGNGTTRSTDGSGFANFGTYNNVAVNYSVTKSGYSSANGSVNTGGSGTTVYPTLSPSGGCGSPAPSASISANPTSITSGQSSTLTWSSSNASSCSVSPGGWSGTNNSASTGALTNTTTYTVTCTGAGGTATHSATVTVTGAPSTYTVSGYVYRDYNSTTCCSGVKDAGEPGFSGRSVSLTNQSSGAAVSSATTDGNGYFSMAGISAGSYRITHAIPAGYSRTTDDSFPFTMSGNYSYNFGLYAPDPVIGACGTANKTYSSGVTGYGTDTFCSAGAASPASPAFPAAGSSTNWTCLGANGGADSSQCTATRQAAAAAGTYSLTVIKSGSGNIVGTGSDPINCGASCSKTYPLNTSVTLTATPASSYWVFTGWSGDCNGLGACVLIINRAKTATANFELRAFNYSEF